ncbi:MAG: DPP IV N-terminal domain-containing protein [Bacteroidota bacterium]
MDRRTNCWWFWSLATGTLGWLDDGKTLWFTSEETGYVHLYSYNLATSKKTALTSGKFEVQNVDLARIKSFFISSRMKFILARNIITGCL